MLMNTDRNSALEKSKSIIGVVLSDLSATYDGAGGGGISHIKMLSTNTLEVSLLQEERVDVITYEIEVADDGQIRITNRTESTRTR